MFDVEGARKEGYSDAEIADYLGKESGFDVKGAIAEGYTPTDIISHLTKQNDIDRDTGASYGARFAIGSATDPKDKLARARAYLGDSVQMEKDGNISFMNPDTGKRTLVNPEGLDFGDVFGVGRELAGMASSVPGALLGSLAGPIGTILGGAATGTAGSQLADVAAAKMARNAAEEKGNAIPEVQSVKDAAIDTAQELGMNAAGGAILGGAGKLLSNMLNPIKPEIAAAWKSLKQQIPSIGAGGSRSAAMFENAVGDTISGTKAVTDAVNRGNLGLENALINQGRAMAGQNNLAATPEELGALAKMMAADSKNAFKNTADARFSAIENAYADSPAYLNNTRQAIDDLVGKQTGDTAAATRANAERLIQNILNDEKNDVLNMANLTQTRKLLHKIVKGESPIDTASLEQGQIKKLLQGLTADAEDVLANAAPRQGATMSPLDEWREVNRWYRGQKAQRAILNSLFGKGETKAADSAVGGKLLNPTLTHETVNALQQTLPQESFDLLRGSIARQLGNQTASSGMEGANAARVARLLGEGRGAYSPETQRLLFGNNLDDVRTIAKGMADAGKLYNTSRTASINEALRLLKSPAQWAQFGGMAGDLGTSLLVPFFFSKAMTSPLLINFLAKPQSPAMKKMLEQILPVIGQIGGGVNYINRRK